MHLRLRAKARRQDTLRLSGRPADWRQELRAQALACTAEDVRGYAEVLPVFPPTMLKVEGCVVPFRYWFVVEISRVLTAPSTVV